MSNLIRYTQNSESPKSLGPSQILEVTVAAEILTPGAGISVDGASAQGIATLVAAPVGRCVGGASANGVATLVAIPIGTSVAGASTQGVAAKIAAVSGTCVGGSLAQGTAAQIAFPSGRGVGGSLAQGTATFIGIPIGTSVAGALSFGSAAQVEVLTPSGTSVAGSSAQGVAAATAIPSGASVAGGLAQGTAATTAIPSGISVAGALAQGTALPAGVISATGLTAAGSSAQGIAAVTAIPSGSSIIGSSTYGTASQPGVHTPVGVCAAGGSAQGTTTSGVYGAMEAADFFVGPLMNELLACLCEEAAQAPGAPGICCFRVGTEIVHDAGVDIDQCCAGIAYVTLGDTYPSAGAFPEQDVVRQADAKCGPPAWAQSFKLGIIRCSPVGGLHAIPCTDWNTAAVQNVIDSRTLRRVSCCFRDFIVENESQFLGMSIVIERQSQGNPQGGCIERSLTLVAQIPNDCNC